MYINNMKFLARLIVMCADEITSFNFLRFLRSCRSYRIDPPSVKKKRKRLSHLTAPWKLSDLLAVILELASLGRKIRKLFRGRLLVSRLLLRAKRICMAHGGVWSRVETSYLVISRMCQACDKINTRVINIKDLSFRKFDTIFPGLYPEGLYRIWNWFIIPLYSKIYDK